MRNQHNRLVRTTSQAAFSAMLITLLLSCSADISLLRDAQRTEESMPATPYSLVFVIHGDGDYLYHDTSGTQYEADVEALAEARNIAHRNLHAEVFIFHQRPRKHFMLFFPLHDGEFYYYRNGRLIANELYWRDQDKPHFDPEVELYRLFSSDKQRVETSMFLYFGHAIPEFSGSGYDASFPDRTFTVHDLEAGLQSFARDSARFDLMVLATCFGGTPYTIGALGSFARYIIASPDNLHLSYFDLTSLERLDLRLRNTDVSVLAKRFAHQAFERLTRDVQTAVSVAVYDADRVQDYVRSVHPIYDHTLSTLTRDSMTAINRCDCADLPEYVQSTMNSGMMKIFYRPARFGRSKHKQSHSGWECWQDANR
ncbi:MAG: hypothetical protein ACKVRP_05975 [Bacteroidota bacterium]